ncbi:MAG: hypothetical protein HY323_09045 [Betaproteobacteria bacterium]|nr:hypothetical protein [Betaproteobacteria bacterium]
MKETLFHAELSAAFRHLDCWMAKWPDVTVSHMQVARDGKMRFALPKPCDLIGMAPGGRFLAVEAKLARSPIFHVDARLIRQLDTLRAFQERGAFAALALNFRFVRKRPPLRVNRTLLFLGLTGEAWTEGRAFVLGLTVPFLPEPKPAAPMPRYVELRRIAGGWEISEELLV